MVGGLWGALVPLLVLVTVLVWVSLADGGGTRSFWAGAWLALATGLLLARDKTAYCQSVVRGLGDKNGVVIVTAWLFAGVFGQLMVAGGLVDGLLWLGFNTGATGAAFATLTFVLCVLFALGTGTSTGMALALGPVLYPAGVVLGADPAMLALAILSGGALGDNLAPVSDTTIVSAYTQGATMRDVVRTRFPLVAVAAVVVLAVLIVAGGGTEGQGAQGGGELFRRASPEGLLMLVGFVVVITAALRGRHLVEALIYGNLAAAVLGQINGRIPLDAILSLSGSRSGSTGLIEDGIASVVGPIIFALLVLALTSVLVDSGVMGRLLQLAENRLARTVPQAEAAIAAVTALVSVPIAANAPALLLVGPAFVKPLGERFGLAPTRRANLMDCAVCTVFFMVPWHIAVTVWHEAIASSAARWDLPVPSVWIAALNPYCWALAAVLVFSIVTGWNRRLMHQTSSKEAS
jgi:Na+/H+ antiporter NhaC